MECNNRPRCIKRCVQCYCYMHKLIIQKLFDYILSDKNLDTKISFFDSPTCARTWNLFNIHPYIYIHPFPRASWVQLSESLSVGLSALEALLSLSSAKIYASSLAGFCRLITHTCTDILRIHVSTNLHEASKCLLCDPFPLSHECFIIENFLTAPTGALTYITLALASSFFAARKSLE